MKIRWTAVFLGVAAAAALIHVWRSHLPSGSPADDFSSHYFSSVLLAQRRNYFDRDTLAEAARQELDIAWVPSATHAPFYPAILTPLTFLPCPQAYRLYQWINLALLAVVFWECWILLRPTAGGRLVIAAAIIFMFALYEPVWENHRQGQSNVLLTALLLGSFLMLRGGRIWPAGLFLAAAGLVKLIPFVTLPIMLFTRNRRVVPATILWCPALVLISLPFTGTDIYLRYVRDIPDTILHGSGARSIPDPSTAKGSICVNAFLGRALRAIGHGEIHRPSALLLCGAFIGFAAWMCRGWGASFEGDNLRAALAITTSVVASSITWEHHLVILIFPLLAALNNALARGRFLWSRAAAAGGILAVLSLGIGWNMRVLVPLALCAILALYALLCLALRAERRGSLLPVNGSESGASRHTGGWERR